MKKSDVKVGQVYSAKVSGSIAPVRITEEKWKGDKHTGWVGTNTQTGRSVYIKSAQRLRAPAAAAHGGDGGVAGAGGEPSAKAASPVPPKAASGGTGKKVKKATGGQKEKTKK